MENEGKKESLWSRIKSFFKNLFKKNKIKALPEKTQQGQLEEININCAQVEACKTTQEEINNNKQIGKTDNNEEQIENYKTKDVQNESLNNEEEPIRIAKSKEEYLKMYKDVKDKNINPNILTEDELKAFIQLAKQELGFINKKIDEEMTLLNMYKEKIAYYKQKNLNYN